MLFEMYFQFFVHHLYELFASHCAVAIRINFCKNLRDFILRDLSVGVNVEAAKERNMRHCSRKAPRRPRSAGMTGKLALAWPYRAMSVE